MTETELVYCLSTDKGQYFAHDSWGSPYTTPSLIDADHYKTPWDAEAVFQSIKRWEYQTLGITHVVTVRLTYELMEAT